MFINIVLCLVCIVLCNNGLFVVVELPLVLYDCEFEDVDWIYEPGG